MIAVLLPALERHGRVTLDEATRAKLLEVSAATIDRLLTGVRLVAGSGRRRPSGFGSAVRRSVPIRTFNDWGDPAPGWVEVDFVSHGGDNGIGGICADDGADGCGDGMDGMHSDGCARGRDGRARSWSGA